MARLPTGMGQPDAAIGRIGFAMGVEESAGGDLPNGGTPESGVVVTEHTGSQAIEVTATEASLTRLFDINGLNSTFEALSYLPHVGSLFAGSLRAVGQSLTSVGGTDDILKPLLRGTVRYERKQGSGVQFLETDDFSFGGETINIKQVSEPANARHYDETGQVDTGPATDAGTSINADPNTGEAEGVNVLDPIMNYTAVRYIDGITTDQARTILSLEGKVNSGDFFGFEPGEVLFVNGGAQDMRAQGVYKLTYNFQMRLNRTGSNPLVIALTGEDPKADPVAVQIDKEGWEYLVLQSSLTDEEAVNQFAHVYTVFETASFSALPNLGTTTPWENRPEFPPTLSFPPA